MIRVDYYLWAFLFLFSVCINFAFVDQRRKKNKVKCDKPICNARQICQVKSDQVTLGELLTRLTLSMNRLV